MHQELDSLYFPLIWTHIQELCVFQLEDFMFAGFNRVCGSHAAGDVG